MPLRVWALGDAGPEGIIAAGALIRARSLVHADVDFRIVAEGLEGVRVVPKRMAVAAAATNKGQGIRQDAEGGVDVAPASGRARAR